MMTHFITPALVTLVTPGTAGLALGYTAAPARAVLAVTAVLVAALVAYAVTTVKARRQATSTRPVAQVDPFAELRYRAAVACSTIDRLGERQATAIAAEIADIHAAREAVASVTALATETNELFKVLNGGVR